MKGRTNQPNSADVAFFASHPNNKQQQNTDELTDNAYSANEKPAVAEVDILEQEVIEADNLVIVVVPQGIVAGNPGSVEDNSIIEGGGAIRIPRWSII